MLSHVQRPAKDHSHSSVRGPLQARSRCQHRLLTSGRPFCLAATARAVPQAMCCAGTGNGTTAYNENIGAACSHACMQACMLTAQPSSKELNTVACRHRMLSPLPIADCWSHRWQAACLAAAPSNPVLCLATLPQTWLLRRRDADHACGLQACHTARGRLCHHHRPDLCAPLALDACCPF